MLNTCHVAREEGFSWAWVDTCCIDKTNLAELAESIDSMFRWYRDAAVCHAYLSDLAADADLAEAMPRCRWFGYGWTLQEPLAPATVQFHDQGWTLRGTKDTLVAQLEAITGIAKTILCGHRSLNQISIGARMSWAARRKTTRPEDIAYCLLGIFDVNMPLIYGEGTKAFRRLQEEIIHQSNDLSILAWNGGHWDMQGGDEFMRGLLLAPSPDFFKPRPKQSSPDEQLVTPGPRSAWGDINTEYAITNKGLRMRNSLVKLAPDIHGQGNTKGPVYFLSVAEIGSTDESSERGHPQEAPIIVGLILQNFRPNIFMRQHSRLWRICFNQWRLRPAVTPSVEMYIEPDNSGDAMHRWAPVHGTISIPTTPEPPTPEREATAPCDSEGGENVSPPVVVAVDNAVPESLWNRTSREFFRMDNSLLVLAVSFTMEIGDHSVHVLCLIDQRKDRPSTRLLRLSQHPEILRWFSSRKAATKDTFWEDFSDPLIPRLMPDLCITLGQQQYLIRSRLPGLLSSFATRYQLWLDVERLGTE